MSRWITLIIATLLASTLASTVSASRVEDFVLIDQNGRAHELYYHKNASAVVLVAQGNGCAAVDSTVEQLKALRTQYADKGVQFLMINSSADQDRAAIRAEAQFSIQ